MNLNSLPLSARRKIDKIFSNSTSKAGIEKESAHFSSIIIAMQIKEVLI